MEHVRWDRRPALHRPVLITAFSGWNDAGDAASNAVRYLADQWDAQPFAAIDGDAFYDYTDTRPTVRLVDGATRALDWPEVELLAADLAGQSADPDVGDAVLLTGPEPQLHWRTFCREVTELATALGVTRVLHLGALLSEVPHTRPVPLVASGDDASLLVGLGAERSRYEGPTGIVGVLQHACAAAGFPTSSLWATVPTYVSGAPSPKATLALVSGAAALLRLDIDTALLAIAAEAYEREVDALVADDDDTVAYLQRLELRHDLGPVDDDADDDESDCEDDTLGFDDDTLTRGLSTGAPGGGRHHPSDDDDTDPARLADEVERFLREHNGDT